MSVPGNINTAPPPSSFDGDANFYEESRWKKLKRKMMEEPLLPLGCGLTCWALYEASKSIKLGDKHRTNRMFRRRIYAQGFTILAMIAGQIYWASDREKRKKYEGLVDDKKRKEKHDAWIKELEARDQEEQELRQIRDKLVRGEVAERQKYDEGEKRAVESKIKKDLNQPRNGVGAVRSALEDSDQRRTPIFAAVQGLWDQFR